MAKILFVYYSLTGSVHEMIQTMHKEVPSDGLRLETVHAIKSSGAKKFFIAGWQVITRNKPQLKKYDFKPENYDHIIVGTPVWMGNIAPAIRTFFAKHQFKNKKMSYVICAGNESSIPSAMTNLKTLLGNNIWHNEITFIEPIKGKKEHLKKAIDWIKAIAK